MPIRYLPHTRFARANKKAGSGGPSYSAEYQAVYDAFETTPSAADADAQNTYVKDGVDNGWWGEEDREFVLASHASGRDSLLDWLDPTNNAKVASIVNNPAWVQYQGYTGGTNEYIRLNYIPSTAGLKATANDTGIFAYSRGKDNSDKYDLGVSGNNGKGWAIEDDVSGKETGQVNSSGAAANGGVLGELGFSYAENKSSAADGQVLYKNTTEIDTADGSSAGLPDLEVYGLALNFLGGPFGYGTRQVSLIGSSKALGLTKLTAKRNAFQALMTHYGTQV